jgi:hypothetical protein
MVVGLIWVILEELKTELTKDMEVQQVLIDLR